MTIVNKNKDVFLAIDANAIIHRAFHAYPSTLQTEEGLQVNAVYGFTTMLLVALEMFKPKYVVCAMDTNKPTFRHEKYQEYKATRKPTDLSLIDQFPLVEEVLKAFNIPVLKKDGFEADDVLGSISKYVSDGIWSSENLDLYILSGDRDLLQLINNNIYVCLPNGNFKNVIVYDRENTHEKYGYYPEQVIEYKAIVGDASDNIPGVKGIGDKTALEMLDKYKDLDGIYNNINEIKERYRKLLVEGVEQAQFSKELATIDKDIKLDIHLTDCILQDLNRNILTSTFKKYGFKSLMSKLDNIFGMEEVPSTTQLDIFNTLESNYVISNEEDVKRKISESKEIRIAYINKEESFDSNEYIFVRCIDKDNNSSDHISKPFDIFNSLNIKSIVYNFEELVKYSEGNLEYTKIYDVSLLGHILNSEKRDIKLKDLAFEYSSKVLKEKISLGEYSTVLDVLENTYLAQIEKVNSLEMYEYTRNSIKRYINKENISLISVLQTLEQPISKILSDMEDRGILVDWKRLESLREEVLSEINTITKDIYDTVGHEFNINSPKQLSDVLYKELNLPRVSKDSTRESVLKSMIGLHPVVEKLLQFREVSKILSTYVEPLYQNTKLDSENMRSVHTDFKQTGTTSGRFSSANPNMQNIPIGSDWATKVRECFISRPEFKLLSCDYSQMELRIMADISNDRLLIKDFNDGIDIHTSTASRVLNKKVNDISSKERGIGKVVNFGMIFGQTPFGLSRLLGIDRETAGKYINAYFKNYEGVEEYMRNTEQEAFSRGYVQTMFGTTRHISGIRSRNRRMQAAAAREAINMPIQGSEADIMKYIMVKLDNLIKEKYKNKAFMLLQVHDEIIFEVEDGVLEKFSKDAHNIMKESINLVVPLEVHVSSGNKLSELK